MMLTAATPRLSAPRPAGAIANLCVRGRNAAVNIGKRVSDPNRFHATNRFFAPIEQKTALCMGQGQYRQAKD
jgi:hypothetical protein